MVGPGMVGYSTLYYLVDNEMTIPRMELNKVVPEAMSASSLLGFGPDGEPSLLADAQESIKSLGLTPDDFMFGRTFNPDEMLLLSRVIRYVSFLNGLREDLNEARNQRLAHMERSVEDGR